MSDPRTDVAKLTDELPLLLFPLRIETRFKRIVTLRAPRRPIPVPREPILRGRLRTRPLPIPGLVARLPRDVGAIATGIREPVPRLPGRAITRLPVRDRLQLPQVVVRHELWVRVFPDPCLIDTFESEPSQGEVDGARRYWQAIWRSRGEDGERAAWRNLVASHGAGRAAWLRDAHAPLDPAARPAPQPPETLVLAIPVEQGWSDDEVKLLVQLWEQAWRAGADGGAEAAALKQLADELGDEQRAQELWAASRPLGFNDPPPDPKVAPADASVLAVAIAFPAVAGARAQSWSSPPVVRLLPERLLCVVETAGGRVEQLGAEIATPLQVGPDPSASEANPDLRPIPETGELEVSEALRWTVDFEQAVKVGMGFKIPLSADQWLHGADRVTVVGVRLGDDPDEGGRKHLEELLAHHRDGRSGLELIPQGTPTNNTEEDGSGWTKAEEADDAFDRLRDAGDLGGDPAPPPAERLDGRWLADGLGIDPAMLNAVPGAGGSDQAEARLMNRALWPATLGYFLDTMMEPLVGEETVDQARWFFTSHVSGRGPLPPLRVGQQPYGIVPAIAFDRTKKRPVDGDGKSEREQFLLQLHRLLHVADDDWAQMSQDVVSLGTPGADVEAALLEVLGLHPASAEFHYRYAQSLAHLFNLAGFFGLWQVLLGALLRAALDLPALDLLKQLGNDDEQRPAIVDKYFLGRQGRLLGAIVDDRPLSETDPVRAWTENEENYLAWLAGAASSGLDDLRRQEGFLDGRPPRVLLYMLLRHALLLGYADAGVRLHRTASVPAAQLKALRREPPFVHVADAGDSESRWTPLFKQDDAITGEPGLTVAEAVAKRLWGGGEESARLTAQIEAVKRLSGLPTARLERLLAEHVDTCSYRFDAWRTGWLAHRLEGMREKRPRGVHLGAFGWLLDVRPSGVERTPVEPLGGELQRLFQASGDAVLERDPANGGFVHAPSNDQAVTAAVLRAGYLSNAADGNPEPLQVNLSSERVRLALSTLDGIRNGQRMGALLGYRLERGLHDGHPGLELDRFILPLRTAFPLVAQRISATRAADDGVRAAAARNVADGLRIVEHVESRAGLDRYPFGRGDLLPGDATAAERAAIEAEVRRLRDVNDAVGDLLLAESVHQATQARYDRSAAALDTVSTGGWPPDPEVVRTPRPGVALTHRLALQLDPDAAAAAAATPRAAAEPRLDRWLETVLPDLADVRVRVTWSDPRAADPSAVAGEVTVALADLGLRPVDLLAIVHADGGQQMAELDDRVVAQALSAGSVPLDVLPQIRYLDAVGGAVRVFDVAAPVRRLRSLVGRARPLRPGDWTLAEQATRSADADLARDPAPVRAALRGVQTLARDLGRQVAALDALVRGAPAERARAPDRAIDQTAALFARAALHGIPQTGWGFAYAQRRELAAGLLRRLAERLQTWDAKLADFDLLLAQYDGLDQTVSQRDTALILLRRAEISVATAVTDDDGRSDLAALRAALPARRTAFAARRRALAALVARPPATLAGLLRAAAGLLPLSDVDLEPFDLAPEETALATLHVDLLSAAAVVLAEAGRRAEAARALLAQHDAAATASARVAALDAAARAIFGDEFVLVPDAGVQADRAQETADALTAFGSGELTEHLTATLGVEFPVDEWLTGVARVREQARAWEQVALAAGAFGREEPALTPLQFPFLPGDHWLALGFPPDARLDRDRLLYTAALPAGFDPAARRCGLLLDEWTEVIPADTQETAIATHFDRPDSEPPQALLLVLPTQRTGTWNWPDVIGALDDTLAMARRRAVEPVHVDRTPYARLLPATVSATTLRGLSIGLALALNNPGVRELAQKEAGDG